LPLNGTAKTQSRDVVPSSFPNYHVGLDLLIQLTKHHTELDAQKPQSSLWHEPLKSPQASIFSGWKEVEIAPSGRPKDCRCHFLGRARTARDHARQGTVFHFGMRHHTVSQVTSKVTRTSDRDCDTVTDLVVKGFGHGDHGCFAGDIWAKSWDRRDSSAGGNMNDVTVACLRHVARKSPAT